MRRNAIWLVAVALVVAGATTAVATSGNFQTHLSGDEEVAVPAVVTGAQGQATFKLSDDGDSITYKLNVANIENVTQAHIHMAPFGANGGIVVWLFPSAPPATLIPGRTDGNLAEGTITAANLVGDLIGKPLSALIDVISAGNAYVNVHTSQYPPGEIRGQL
jgi:CHRD domain